MNSENVLIEKLEELLKDKVDALVSISGGDINEARKISGASGNYFLKFNRSPQARDMFIKESRGLSILSDSDCMRIPKVLATDYTSNVAFLVLEFIQTGYPNDHFWKTFGQQLAKMHDKSSNQFGLDHDNYIGRLHQSNTPHDTWVEFFINERLQPQIDLAASNERLRVSEGKKFSKLFKRLPELLDEGKPALLHGDLWNGNFICDQYGSPVLIDPAVYYGHREADLAMTKLFGGFSHEFYRSYEESSELAKGWENRLEIYQLYYLMVHVNLFGRSYMSGITRTLDRYQ